MLKQIVVATLMVSLVGCSTGATKMDSLKIADVLSEQTGQKGRSCVRISDIKGYGFDTNVVNIDGRRNYYVATTVMRCHAADMAMAAVFDGPQGEVCGGGSSRIIAGGDECVIGRLFEFDNREQAMAAVAKARETMAGASVDADKDGDSAASGGY